MEKGKKKGKQIGFIVEEQKQSEALQRNLPPLVIDADALNLLARIENWPAKLPRECILTPHPGEMARLTGISVEEIQRNRCDVAGKYAAKWKQVVILKGAFTVIAHPDGRTATIPIATAALAKGGTGDILAGLVCGFLAQGMESFPAAWSAAWIHAQAGIRAAEDLGSDTAVMAWDVMNALPKIFRGLSR
jgi:NAD(P)H-hydrate epimerase